MPLSPHHGAGSIRDPRDPKQEKGLMWNPPRYMKMGGLSGPSKGKKEAFAVKKPMPGVKP